MRYKMKKEVGAAFDIHFIYKNANIIYFLVLNYLFISQNVFLEFETFVGTVKNVWSYLYSPEHH